MKQVDFDLQLLADILCRAIFAKCMITATKIKSYEKLKSDA